MLEEWRVRKEIFNVNKLLGIKLMSYTLKLWKLEVGRRLKLESNISELNPDLGQPNKLFTILDN